MSALNRTRLPLPHLVALVLKRLLLLSLLLAFLMAGLGTWTLLRQETSLNALMRLHLHHVSEAADFHLKHIVLHGQQRLSREPLLAALALQDGEPLALIDLHAAQARLESLEWVAGASLRRIFPDTIEVRLQEEQPFALWERGGHLFLVNREGEAFLDLGAAADGKTWEALHDFAHFPWLVGVGALDHGMALLETMDAWPALRENLRAAIRVGERRWDLHLAPDIRARLPEHGMHVTLARLQRLHEEYDIFNRDVRVIDLRLADRIGFRLGENAIMPEMSEALPEAPHRDPQHVPRGDG